MAKKAKKLGTFEAPLSLDELRQQQSAYLDSLVSNRKRESGTIWAGSGDDLLNTVIALPCPLLFQILIQSSGLPLERLIQVVGVEGTFKSAFGYEVGRWFNEAGGYMNLIEHESKFSATFCSSIMGYSDEIGYQPYEIYEAQSQEDWQSCLTQLMRDWKSKSLAASSPGPTYPLLFNLDSLMGKLTRESQKKIDKEGFAGRQFAIEALSITNYLRSQANQFAEWPAVFLAVNHVKPQEQEGPYTPAIRRKAGGRQVAIQETFEIQVDKGRTLSVPASQGSLALYGGGQIVRMKCYKNSLGETGREIEVPVKWQYLPSELDGTPRQYTKWCWEEGLVTFLLSTYKGLTEVQKRKIDEVCFIRALSGNKVYCKQLGSSASNPVTREELGEQIENSPEMTQHLRHLFAVHTREVYVPGVDYRLQLARVREKAREAKERHIQRLEGATQRVAQKKTEQSPARRKSVRSSGGDASVPRKRVIKKKRVRTQSDSQAPDSSGDG